MRNKRFYLNAGFVVLISLSFVLFKNFSTQKSETLQTVAPQITSSKTKTEEAYKTIPFAQLADAQVSPAKRIERSYILLQNYLAATKSRKGPPLTSNAEFTAAFTGKNPLGIVFIEPNHPAINQQGELLDPWETPYFFHALAADSYELISAGPDKIKFNQDDIVYPRRANIYSLQPLKNPDRR